MKSLVLMLALVALTGCTFCRTHDRTCALAGGVALTSLALTIHGGHSRTVGTQPAPDVTTQPVVCTSGGNCK